MDPEFLEGTRELIDVVFIYLKQILFYSFGAILIYKFLNYWTDRIIDIVKLKSMNILADDRWIHINGMRGNAKRKAVLLK